MNVELIDFYATDGVLNNGYIKSNYSNKILISTHGMGSNCFKARDKVISNIIENIDYFAYNNRGSEIVRHIKKIGKEVTKIIAGTTFEDVEEGYEDIKGAILKVIDLGYKEIFLQGHSLGATKVVYTYNRLKTENSELLKYIKGIILLSLVDIPRAIKVYLNENYEQIFKIAEEKEQNEEKTELMPNGSFIYPISVKTFLRYTKYNKKINFANFSNKENNFEVLNNIDIPIFMRWGNVNEMIEQEAKELVDLMNSKINNQNKDINFINGADHSYNGKEEILAEEIKKFLNKYSITDIGMISENI